MAACVSMRVTDAPIAAAPPRKDSTSFCIVGSDNSRTIMTHNDGRGGAVDLRQIQVGRARIDISQGQLARAMHVPGSPPDRGQSHET